MKRTPLILLCDEDTSEAGMTAFLLRSAGFSVRTTNSALEATVLASRDRPDLILMELRMPWYGGDAACKLIRSKAELRGIPIVLTSALPPERVREKVDGAGAAGYLPKPFDKDALLAAVQARLRESALSPTA